MMACEFCPCAGECVQEAHLCAVSSDPKWHAHIRNVSRIKLADPRPEIYPTLAIQALSFLREIFAFVRSGGKLASKGVRKARLAVCDKCRFWNRSARRCQKCGCKADVKVHSLVAQCPIGAWPTDPASPEHTPSPDPATPSS